MEIFLATGNEDKRREIQDLFPGLTFLLPRDRGLPWDVKETGTSFFENALLKAAALSAGLGPGRPVLADDSGLCVDLLAGGPGVESARFGSVPGAKPLSAEDRNALLLQTLEQRERESPETGRGARFVCALVLFLSPYRIYSVQEAVEGEILKAPRGSGGFGYDPLFFLPSLGKTMAELSREEKNRRSHRGLAGAKMNLLLRSLG
ncbi:MAG: non-canonical purine NTP pyrophosphatase [Spirochaetales bacterium]|jgi:XTP/dITP diphosphohydrolase|nr:non-canonical purine NTP pyrophosphatase [Spirochaetales bacterium]